MLWQGWQDIGRDIWCLRVIERASLSNFHRSNMFGPVLRAVSHPDAAAIDFSLFLPPYSLGIGQLGNMNHDSPFLTLWGTKVTRHGLRWTLCSDCNSFFRTLTPWVKPSVELSNGAGVQEVCAQHSFSPSYARCTRVLHYCNAMSRRSTSSRSHVARQTPCWEWDNYMGLSHFEKC